MERNLHEFDTDKGTDWLRTLGYDELNKLAHDRARRKVVIDRVVALRRALEDVFVGKSEIIRLMTECTLAGLPLLLLGTWGTGKSMLVRKFAAGLGIGPRTLSVDEEDEEFDGLDERTGEEPKQPRSGERAGRLAHVHRRHFEYLITKFTTPEELLGGMHVDLMLKKSIFRRVTRGLLPRAEIVFLDEVFKANSAILNALLSILNERLIYNAGHPWTVNMVMLFGASNEPPQEQGLVVCNPVMHSEDALLDLLSRAHEQSFASTVGEHARAPHDVQALRERAKVLPQRACVNDFRLLHKVSMLLFGASDVRHGPFAKNFARVLMQLRNPYEVSDRSVHHFYRLARARALLDGRDELEPQDLQVFHYCANDPKGKLSAVVDDLIG